MNSEDHHQAIQCILHLLKILYSCSLQSQTYQQTNDRASHINHHIHNMKSCSAVKGLSFDCQVISQSVQEHMTQVLQGHIHVHHVQVPYSFD